jgi:hypothetical protein
MFRPTWPPSSNTLCVCVYIYASTGTAQSLPRLATGRTVPRSNPGGGGKQISAPIQTDSTAQPAYYTMCTHSFPGVKRQRLGVNHNSPSSAEVKYRIELQIYSPSVPSWQLQAELYPFLCKKGGYQQHKVL